MSDLLPCPFCGAQPPDDGDVKHDESCFIEMMIRRSRFWLPDPGVMERAWNTRATPTAPHPKEA